MINIITTIISVISIINTKLPIMNNIYKTNLNLPLIGNQYIEYKRFEKYTSSLKLYGIINTDGFLYFDKNNPQNYSFDDNIKNVMSKYKCKINEAYYNNVSDQIFLKLKIKLLNIQKTIILKNQNSKNSKNIYQKNDL